MTGAKNAHAVDDAAEGQGLDGALEELEAEWCVERKLGKGGMGTVYLAHDVALKRPVAIKVMAAQHCTDERLVERFDREARLMARLEHPNLVPVYSVGRTSCGPYIVMKFLEGMTLADHLKNIGRMTLDAARDLTRQLSAGLQFVHDQRVVHRDVKPANVYLGPDGHVTLLDLGVAREWSSDLTKIGVLIGTPRYMAPEVLQGDRADHRSDLYALATVICEALTGKPPIDEVSERLVIRAHLDGIHLDPADFEGVPPAVVATLARGLAKAPEERYGSVLEFAQAFEEACSAGPGEAVARGVETRFEPVHLTIAQGGTHTRMEGSPSGERAARRDSNKGTASTERHGTESLDGRGTRLALRRTYAWGAVAVALLVFAGLAMAGALAMEESPPAAAPVRAVPAPPTKTTTLFETPKASREVPRVPEASGTAEVRPDDDDAAGDGPGALGPSGSSRGTKGGQLKRSHAGAKRNKASAAKDGTADPSPSAGSVAQVRCVAVSNKAAVRAYVEVDGMRLGATPINLKLEAGQHRLEFIRDGFKTEAREVTLASGDNLDMLVDMGR